MPTFKTVSVRLTMEEMRAIQEGAAALGISQSTLVSTAALSAAHRLGFYEDRTEGAATPVPGSWLDKPARQDESAAERTVISINPLEYEAIQKAAQWSFVSVPLFLVGSTMRFLANRKKKDPENPKLASLHLPEPFD